VLLQNRSLVLRSSPKATETILLSDIRFWWRLYTVNGAILTAWICGIAPGVRRAAAVRRR